ncbi:MAG TPA: isoprenyl transferase [Chloroflexota bacterium]|nr:isoprenyl transferase [Chloroflexota bacterium]
MERNARAGQVVEPSIAVPEHVAIIMDGNGRWAAERGLPRSAGHRAGTENIRGIIQTCADVGVKILTLYAFSTENWRRPYDEVDALFSILSEVIDRETQELCRKGVRIRHLGTLEHVPPSLAQRIRNAVETTRMNTGLIVNVAFNYGSRSEIVRAVRRIMAQGVDPSDVTEEVISTNLDTSGMPDPDLIIRTAGEIRLSNFLLWQAAYAEYWATDVYWPDFDVGKFRSALDEFGRRQRRFGAVPGEHQRSSA